jgi:hypothetical protein
MILLQYSEYYFELCCAAFGAPHIRSGGVIVIPYISVAHRPQNPPPSDPTVGRERCGGRTRITILYSTRSSYSETALAPTAKLIAAKVHFCSDESGAISIEPGRREGGVIVIRPISAPRDAWWPPLKPPRSLQSFVVPAQVLEHEIEHIPVICPTAPARIDRARSSGLLAGSFSSG